MSTSLILLLREVFSPCGGQSPCFLEKLRLSQCLMPVVGAEPRGPRSSRWKS